MRAALYARVSTDKQAEKFGISSQLYEIRKKCRQKKWASVYDGGKDAFIDDGYSGADLDRPALNRLRQAVREGRVDTVMVYDPDRLSRKLFHLMILADEFDKQGVKLEFVTQEMGTSADEKMFFTMRGAIAEYEREKVRERTMRGRLEKARQGKLVSAGSTPFGYKYNPKTATLEDHPQTAKTVRLIFHTFANEDLSIRALTGKLNRLQLPAPRGGGKWSPSTLAFILKNEAYTGKMYQFKKYRVKPSDRHKTPYRSSKTSVAIRPREEWIPFEVPALVSPEVFETVQWKLARNTALASRNTKREYLLSGLLHCSYCGGRMGGNAMHGTPYYRCYHKGDPDKYLVDKDSKPYPCSLPEVKTELIDGEVWDSICRLIKDPDLLIDKLRRQDENSSQTSEILEQEMAICRNRLKSIPREKKKLVEGYRKGLYPDSLMHEEMTVIDGEQGEIDTRIAEIKKQLSRRALTKRQEENIRNMVENVTRNLDDLDFSSRQRLLRLLVDRVIYDGQQVRIQTVIPLEGELCPIHRGGLRR